MYQDRKSQFDEAKAQAQRHFSNTITREGLKRDIKISKLTIAFNKEEILDAEKKIKELDEKKK